MAVSTSACMCVHSAVYPIEVCVRLSVWLHCISAHAHIWLYVCVSLCVHKATLDGHWGRRWPSRCVCLGSSSAFHIPLWYSVLWPQETRPAKKLSLSLCKALFLSLSCHLPISLSWFLSFPPFLSIIYSALFSYLNLRNHPSPPPPHPTLGLFSRSLKVSPQRFPPIFSDRGPLMRHLSQRSKSEHTSCCRHWEFTTLLSWSLNVSLRCIFLLY